MKLFSIELWCMFFFFVAQIVDVFLFSSNFSKLYSTQQKVADSSHSLPCSTMLRKVVLIANYLLGASNCIASSQYFAVCCLNECEGIVNHFEAQTLESGSEKSDTEFWRNDGMTWWHETTFQTTWVLLENFNTWLLRLVISDSTPSAPRHRSKCQGLHWSRREKHASRNQRHHFWWNLLCPQIPNFDIYFNRKLTKIIFFFMNFMGISPQKVQKLPKLFVSLLQNLVDDESCFNNDDCAGSSCGARLESWGSGGVKCCSRWQWCGAMA